MLVKKLTLLPIFLVVVNCATFRHQSVPITEQITTRLEQISMAADAATTIRVMTKVQRQDFAKKVMLPAIDANRAYATCLLNNNCGDIPSSLVVLSKSLLVGISDFISILPKTSYTDDLFAKLNSTITFINKIYGGA